uniref:ABC transporter ATP-binding protein n=1 Tax=Nonomuraea bangladeshensis TaxID=404385 RepID=UPI003F495F42
MSLLTVSGVDLHYGDFQAVFDLHLEVAQGEVLAVIGANGAGKSTLLKAVAGQLRPTRGEITFDGTDIAHMAPHRRVRRGIALTPEGRRIFKSLTVEDNLKIGGFTRRDGPWNLRTIYETFPLLAERRDRLGGNLSGGEQQATAIGRSLMSNPRILLVDEVSLGLAPKVVATVYRAIPAIVEQGTSVLLVEQDVNQALAVADRVACLLEGRIVVEGTPDSLTREQITSAYFGI